jgi:hypothetical protein
MEIKEEGALDTYAPRSGLLLIWTRKFLHLTSTGVHQALPQQRGVRNGGRHSLCLPRR